MSDLENATKPVIGGLLRDISLPLDQQQQASLAQWSLKTAIVANAINIHDPQFFSEAELTDIRIHLTIPEHTEIWIGRISTSSLGAFANDLKLKFVGISPIGKGRVTTMQVGHLVIQLLTIRVPKEFSDLPRFRPDIGPWDHSLFPIWPVKLCSVHWPPDQSFSVDGEIPFRRLVGRWKPRKSP